MFLGIWCDFVKSIEYMDQKYKISTWAYPRVRIPDKPVDPKREQRLVGK